MDIINHVATTKTTNQETYSAKKSSSVSSDSQIADTDSKNTSNVAAVISQEVVYETNETNETKLTYQVDMDKVNSMKAETEQRMLQLFSKTINQGFLKQVGGLRGVLEKIFNGEEVDGIDLNIEVTDESIAQAQEDVAEGGYWSPEETSNRFIEFAQALSGGDNSKADLLIDAFKEGYAMAKEMWGGELPEISQKTYDLTLEKFDVWKNEE